MTNNDTAGMADRFDACETHGRGDKLHARRPNTNRTMCGAKAGQNWPGVEFGPVAKFGHCDKCVAAVYRAMTENE